MRSVSNCKNTTFLNIDKNIFLPPPEQGTEAYRKKENPNLESAKTKLQETHTGLC
jgi:hypothetical protein